MRPNEVLTKKFQVERTLNEGEVASFMLLNAGKKEPGREEPSRPEVWQLSPKQYVTDPGDQKRKVIGNVVGTELREGQDGKPYNKDITKGPQFYRGLMHLTADMTDTFHYMMRRKDNESNPFAKLMGGKVMRFKLVDDKREIVDTLLQEDLRFEAERFVRDQRDPLKLRAIAAALNKSPDPRLHINAYNPPHEMDAQAIKLQLIQKVKLFPKHVLLAGDDLALKVRIQLMEAMTWGVLIFQQETFFVYSKKELKEVLKPEALEDKIEALIKYCMSEAGKVDYAEISEALKKAMKVN